MTVPSQNSKVSVIVPSYNYGHYIAACLNSVIAQTYLNWECIVIDNGSTDSTAEIVKAYIKKDSRISYYYTEQKGVSFARNLAVQHCEGDYILPLDADDKIAPTYLEKAVKILSSDATVKVVYCDAELFGSASGKWILPNYSLRDMLVENSIFCSALFRKSDFNTVQGFNEEMVEGFEDWDFWIRMLKNGGTAYKIPEALFYYHIKSGSRNSSLDEEKQVLLRRRIVANHEETYKQTFQLADVIFDNYKLRKELNAVKNSRDLKFGKKVFDFFRSINNLFKK